MQAWPYSNVKGFIKNTAYLWCSKCVRFKRYSCNRAIQIITSEYCNTRDFFKIASELCNKLAFPVMNVRHAFLIYPGKACSKAVLR